MTSVACSFQQCEKDLQLFVVSAPGDKGDLSVGSDKTMYMAIGYYLSLHK